MTTALFFPPAAVPAATASPDVLLAAPASEDPSAAFADLLALLTGAEMIAMPADEEPAREAGGDTAGADAVVTDTVPPLAPQPEPEAAMPWPSGMDRALVLALRTAGAGVQAVQAGAPSLPVPTAPVAAPAVEVDTVASKALPDAVPAVAAPDRAARPVVVSDGAPALFTATLAQDGGTAGTETVLRLPADRADLWKRPLVQALGERLQFQASQGVEQARIRLDPPTLGRIEILLRQEGNQLQVQLSASHPDVARQLQLMGEGLRQELSQRQGVQVSVQVHDASVLADGRSQQQRQQPGEPTEDTPGQALRSESQAGAPAFTLA